MSMIHANTSYKENKLDKQSRFHITRSFASLICILCLLFSINTLQAKKAALKAEATTTSITVLPFVISETQNRDTDVAVVIRADLARTGLFEVLPPELYPKARPRLGKVDFKPLRALKQNYLLFGDVLFSAPGVFRVEYELYNVDNKKRVLGIAATARRESLRTLAHQIADQIFGTVRGGKSDFMTRIAFVEHTKVNGKNHYKLLVADADGFNPLLAGESNQPLYAPAWSADARRLAFITDEVFVPTIFEQQLSTGERRKLFSDKTLQGAISYSPDDKLLAMSLTRNGNADIFLLDLETRAVKQITRDKANDFAPTWMPDGQHLLFSSNRNGKSQIFRMKIDGSSIELLAQDATQQTRSTVSGDGKQAALLLADGRETRIALLDLAEAKPKLRGITSGPFDNFPAFSQSAVSMLFLSNDEGASVVRSMSTNGKNSSVIYRGNGELIGLAWSRVTR